MVYTNYYTNLTTMSKYRRIFINFYIFRYNNLGLKRKENSIRIFEIIKLQLPFFFFLYSLLSAEVVTPSHLVCVIIWSYRMQ